MKQNGFAPTWKASLNENIRKVAFDALHASKIPLNRNSRHLLDILHKALKGWIGSTFTK